MSAVSKFATHGLIVLAALTAAIVDGAAATSPWSEATGARIRLIAPGGPPAADGTLTVGLEIELEPGWKTYWRHPGDAGLPPEIDLSGSSNFAGATIAFPAPHRFIDGGSTSVGYSGTVVLPIRITPEEPALPVMLDARVLYGACRELCVPATGEARLMVSLATRADPAAAELLAAATEAVPGVPSEDFDIASVVRSAEDPNTLVVTATLPEATDEADLFAEGPGTAFPSLPVRVERPSPAPPQWRVVLDKHGPAKGALRLTLVAGSHAVERVWDLP